MIRIVHKVVLQKLKISADNLNMKKAGILSGIFIAVLASTLFAFVTFGSYAPAFIVSDGNDIILDSSSLQGKVIVGFYEDRDQIEKNRLLKNVLIKYYADNLAVSVKNVFMLSVIDASPANFITKPIWKRTFIKNSQLNKVTVYGDWDGSMKGSYGFEEDESTFMIIDKKGVIRYICSGKVPEKYFEGIKEMISRLCQE
jgi:predicted transcriptional regulator